MIGATGAVGSIVVEELLKNNKVSKLTLLGRRPMELADNSIVDQHNIDIFKPESYKDLLSNHDIAICTLGVGEPSKVSKEDFLKIDKEAVYNFAKRCKNAGIEQFELLASVGINAKSRSFYLRSKGELVEDIIALDFERFSVFEPSMILTPTNRYGFSQGLMLKTWPLLKPLLFGNLRKYRGSKIDILGKSIAQNINNEKVGVEHLTSDDFYKIVAK